MNPDTPSVERQEIYHPKIEFITDVESDIKQIRWRINSGSKGWADFEQELDAASNKEEAYKIAEQKIRQFYADHQDEIEACATVVKANWDSVEHSFFQDVDQLFLGYPWPKPPDDRNCYTGYASMLSSFPRNISGKNFSFPAHPLRNWRGRAIRVIAHEMLHFMEYEYMGKKFGLQSSERGSADNTFWQFTENFNVLIENSNFDFWKNTMGEAKPYSDCQELYDKMKKIWDESHSVDVLINEIFKDQLTIARNTE